jgi:type IV pilus assembly protein PilO
LKLGLRELIFLVVMLGLLGGSWWFVFRRADQRRAELRTEIARKEADLENLRKTTAGIEDLGRKVDDLQKAITFFESKLPQQKEMDVVLKEVWRLAQANQMECKTIRTLKSEKQQGYSEQPFELTMSGDFPGFYSFLLQLEKLPRITRLQQMNLQKITEGADGRMTAKITLTVFFAPEASVITASATDVR